MIEFANADAVEVFAENSWVGTSSSDDTQLGIEVAAVVGSAAIQKTSTGVGTAWDSSVALCCSLPLAVGSGT